VTNWQAHKINQHTVNDTGCMSFGSPHAMRELIHVGTHKSDPVHVRPGFKLSKCSYNLIIKAKETHYFSNLFWWRTLHFSDRTTVHHQEYQHQNKFEKYCISLAFIIRIYHTAQSYECQISKFYHIFDFTYLLQNWRNDGHDAFIRIAAAT